MKNQSENKRGNSFYLASMASTLLALTIFSGNTLANGIVHDAEFYVLKSQNGEKWAAEDKTLDKKLAALREKHGRPPNIIGSIRISQVKYSRNSMTFCR